MSIPAIFFPEKLAKAIEYHHQPLRAPEEYKPIIFPIYLGNMIANFLEGTVTFDIIDAKVMDFFSIKTEEQFKVWCDRLQNAYDKQTSKFKN